MSPPQNDESRPRQGGHVSNQVLNLDGAESTARVRQNADVHAWATPVLVLGTRGRLRLVLVVQRCAFGCGRSHVHSAKPDFVGGRRKASCGGGNYLLHLLGQHRVAS